VGGAVCGVCERSGVGGGEKARRLSGFFLEDCECCLIGRWIQQILRFAEDDNSSPGMTNA
jgi:hypothetical protein